MPNPIPAPLGLVDPNVVGTGRQLRAADVDTLLLGLNWSHAEGHAKPVILQEWGDNLCRWNGARVQVCEWAIPVLSGAHVLLDIRVEASATVAAGTVHFNSVVAGATVNAAVPVGAAAWVVLPNLATTGGPATEEFIQLDLEAGAGGTIQVDRVLVRYIQLAALGTASVGGFTPFGSAYGGADQDLPAYVGKTAIRGLADLLARRRSMAAWSGLDANILGHSPNARQALTDNPRVTATPWHHGAEDREVQASLWARVKPDAALDCYLRPAFLFDSIWTWWGEQTTVAAAVAPAAWVSVDFTIPEVSGVRGVRHLLTRLKPVLRDSTGVLRPDLVYGYAVFGV